MTILELIQAKKFDEVAKLVKQKDGVADHAKEYENDRKIRTGQVGKRLDKTVGNNTVTVAKMPIPFQRKIVQSASAFLFGSPVNITDANDKDDIQPLLDQWDTCNMDSIFLDFCEKVKSETEAAIIFFPVKRITDTEIRLKARVLSSEDGVIKPMFDEFGDLVAFCWLYKMKEGDKEIEYMRTYTAESVYQLKKEGDKWVEVKDEIQSTKNLFEKIPVVYMGQKQPDWYYVEDLIDRYEMQLSKHADNNDYFSSPMYKLKGSVDQMPSKDETGKMIKLPIIVTDKGNVIEADVDIISLDIAPENIKLELETEKDLIHGMTDTPDLSFNNVKGITATSGIALKMMFFGAILKAKRDEGPFRIAVNRALNVLIAGMSKITKKFTPPSDGLKLSVEFTSVLPENLVEIIDMLSTATGSKAIMSRKTALSNNPLVDNADEEEKQIQAEEELDVFEPTV